MGLFLLIRALPSLRANNANFLTSAEFVTTDPSNLRFGIAELFQVTVLSSVFALVIAVPIAIGIAAFLTNYAPRRLAKPFAMLVDLLAAVPSIVFGLWGIFVLAPELDPVARFLNDNLGWFFLFADGNVSIAGGGTIFTAGHRARGDDPADHHLGHPRGLRPDPARACRGGAGARRHQVGSHPDDGVPVRPQRHDRRLHAGLGRALGETVAVLIILRAAAQAGHWSLFDGGYTFASKIASAAAEFSAPLPTGAYIAAGFVLFILTFVVNALARAAAGGRVSGG